MSLDSANQARPTAGWLMSLEATVELIKSNKFLTIAGDESTLRRLPKGNWIGGTIPYFMGGKGGETTRDKLFVTPINIHAAEPKIRFYDLTDLQNVCVDGPDNGYSLIIIPAFSAVHSLFAHDAPGYDDMYVKPLVGWVAGIHLDDMGKAAPAVINGQTLEFDHDRAIVMHVELPPDRFAHVDIVNLFRQGTGDSIRFNDKGFSAGACTINGQPGNLADYLLSHKIDTRLPLVADYCGAMINVSIKAVDGERHTVDFYAPVFSGVEYRIAAEIPDYVAAFRSAMPDEGHSVTFCCNCILNYLYSELEGKQTGIMVGPMTFGEIAYQLLNQTLVYMTIEG
jgi:hypothetical protein